MVADLRTRAKVREFFLQWLKVDQVPDLAKDPKQYPGFDAAVASDLRTSLDLFLDDVVWGDVVRFPPAPAGRRRSISTAGWRSSTASTCPPMRRSRRCRSTRASGPGVLTHPYLMATFAYTATSSPIHRGVFLARSVLGRSLRPPPEAVAPLAADLHPDLTTRERVDAADAARPSARPATG